MKKEKSEMENNFDRSTEISNLSNKKELREYIENNYEILTPFNWYYITKSRNFDLYIANEYPTKVDWEYICTCMNLSDSFLEKHKENLDWYSLSAFQHLSKEFIKKHYKELSLNVLCRNENLERDVQNEAVKLYNKYCNNKDFLKRWDENREKSPSFRPSKKLNLIKDKKEEKKKKETEKKLYLKGVKEAAKDPEYIRRTLDSQKYFTEKEKKIPEKSNFNNTKYSRTELKNILEKAGVRVFYHDTIKILEEKLKKLKKD